MPEPGRLSQELATYNRLLPSLSGKEGRYALIAGERLLGDYGTYSDAIEAGYQARGLEPFLVKQIATFEIPPFIDRE